MVEARRDEIGGYLVNKMNAVCFGVWRSVRRRSGNDRSRMLRTVNYVLQVLFSRCLKLDF